MYMPRRFGVGRWLACFLALGYSAAACVAAADEPAARQPLPSVLFNGIELPAPWPPQQQQLLDEPATPPYLQRPPAVITIDTGRQLFVDNFLIDETDLVRTYHHATYYEHNPVLRPDKPWEMTGQNPTAMPFSDGAWYDPEDKLFKLWYMGGYRASVCYAVSKDGIRWEKPTLDVETGTNIVLRQSRDSATVWLDHQTADPQQRFKLGVYAQSDLSLLTSPDGIHWKPQGRSSPTGDRTTFFYCPLRNCWVFSIRGSAGGVPRVRYYWEAADFLRDAQWKSGEPALWTGADRADPIRDDLKTPCQLYNLDAVGYESLLLGLFSIWRGQPNDRAKPNEVCLGYSRDGFHWYRPDRRAFFPVSERHGDWNWGNVQSTGGGCLVVGDKLYFYVSGRAGVSGSTASGVSTTGLAMLRRDGFASMDAAATERTLTTRPVRFSGKYCFVNCNTAAGSLQVELLDADGKVIAPFARENCQSIRADSTRQRVVWQGAEDLSAVAGKPLRLRFYLKQGSLYAFWLSPEASGASRGWVAAGGPGLTGAIDTAGSASRDGK